MKISTFDLFSIGIGPSSSHTVGPMRAGFEAITKLSSKDLHKVQRVQITLYGSLAFTGEGHGTDYAVILGLEACQAHLINCEQIIPRFQAIKERGKLCLSQVHEISFNLETDLVYNKLDSLPFHSNAMRFSFFSDKGKKPFTSSIYYSIGGGFVVSEEDRLNKKTESLEDKEPYPFTSAKELLQQAQQSQLTIAQLMWENEKALHSEDTIRKKLLWIWKVMKACIQKGCETQGVLPGGLNVSRRANHIYQHLCKQKDTYTMHVMDWVSLYALAVNEENAAGKRVVTAPTNGAAGLIPAVLQYFIRFIAEGDESQVPDFLLVASAIGILYKRGASLSAAEVGCQGEVGVACSMAAGALAAVMGGSNEQVENAAEIGMEHNLGLTCDPVKGLVQIPCIERNTMGAIKAIGAARLALLGDGHHHISLDQVIATMKQTGQDMQTIYKETSLGGLAVNHIEC